MKTIRSGRLHVSLMLLSLAFVACSNDPVDLELEDHAEPEGAALVMNGGTIATYDGDAGAWTGELEVVAGEETPHIEVRFLDHDGEPIAFDSDYHLEVEVEEESIALFEQDEPGAFGGHLHGVAVGDTELTFTLKHGAIGSGHDEFITEDVIVRVS